MQTKEVDDQNVLEIVEEKRMANTTKSIAVKPAPIVVQEAVDMSEMTGEQKTLSMIFLNQSSSSSDKIF